MSRRAGIIKFYNANRGFGFVAPDDGTQEIFIHFSNIQDDCMNGLMEGEQVEFNTEYDDRKGKTKATFVTGPGGLAVRGTGKGLTKGAIKGGYSAWNPGKGKGKGEFGGGSPLFGSTFKGKGKAGSFGNSSPMYIGAPPMTGYPNTQGAHQLPPAGAPLHGYSGAPPAGYRDNVPQAAYGGPAPGSYPGPPQHAAPGAYANPGYISGSSGYPTGYASPPLY
eukprot:GEMP01091779.1.p1 GENE.GEMP01091779.1~~GEMP01091779.1.p1  ORF type:complete len:221 (+),score=42.65 GEMP01091779.1:136-798(+)